MRDTNATGDIREIGEIDFSAMDCLTLSRSVYGGNWYKIQHISDVPSFMHTIHLLLQLTPDLFGKNWLSIAFGWTLSEDSPNWYDCEDGDEKSPSPPFRLQLIQAGSRLGWSWCDEIGSIRSLAAKAATTKLT